MLAVVEGEIGARDSGALFSPCRRWRYLLWRRWDPTRPVCMFVGLNPSTADELKDDPTVRRCMNFARDWGYGEMWMGNTFAYRATDPAEMRAQGGNACGPLNNEYLLQAARTVDLVVAAWGNHGAFLGRGAEVRDMLCGAGIRLHALGFTGQGEPRHPLYLSAALEPVVWLHVAR